jgi:hypothetical protein
LIAFDDKRGVTMKKKYNILKAAIAIFMVLSTSLVTSDTLAYWAEAQNAQASATATVNTGDWAQAFPFDENYSYQVGDLVTNNGVTYEAKKSGSLREPGVDRGWNRDWTQI